MDAIKLLEYLQEIMDTSARVPMTGKVMVNKKEIQEVLDKIVNCLPSELKKAQWIVEEKNKILTEAVQEADNIKKENLNLLRKQIENHDITKEANMRAQEIISSAQKNAKAIRLGARDYADEMLNQLDGEITDKSNEFLTNLKLEFQKTLNDLEGKIDLKTDSIRENIKELRDMK
ncbi:MAG TPA: ATPase [Clostridium sp.]|uniref:ATPase n=1 Tax=Clostridium lapidicellarium TaxID=3240931 RepID=A0ABV4DSY4_9CLOT|nr:ATPase [uncultured Clostridium sp.]NLU07292.1 ATPase [Clostridiales bacterium]HBC97726.1 ATPase [Clostridium sp.]